MTLSPDELAELEEERHFLLGSLADLERERGAGDVGDDDYRTLRDGYTVRAAAVLRAIDAGRPPPGATRAPRDRQRLLVTALATLLVAGVAGVAVVRYVAPRQGGGVTGDLPDAVAAKLSLARQLQSTGDVSSAIKVYQDVLTTDPDNAEARTYLGWMIAFTFIQQGVDVTSATDQVKANLAFSDAQFDRAITVNPDYADPRCFKAIVRFRFFRDAPGAKAAVDACVAAKPPEAVAGLVGNLKADIDRALTGG